MASYIFLNICLIFIFLGKWYIGKYSIAMSNKAFKTKTHNYNLSVEEVYKILTSKHMKHLKCNFKVYKPNPGGSNTRTRKPPKYFIEFQNQMLDFIKEQREFNKLIMSRLDNLVAKNNLKE